MSTPEIQPNSQNGTDYNNNDKNEFQNQAFLLPAIIVATASFLVNLVQLISLCRRAPKLQNHMPRMILAMMGLCSCIPPFWYVAAISHPAKNFLHNRDLCFLIPSGFILFPLLGMGAVFNYQALEEHFKSAKLKPTATRNFTVCMAVFAALLSMLPSCGWNSWRGTCCLPHVWSRGFALFIAIIYFLHVILNLLILIKAMIVNHKQQQMVSPCETTNTLEQTRSKKKAQCLEEIVPFIVHTATSVPIIVYVGHTKLNNISTSPAKCTADINMTWPVLLFTAFTAFLPIWNMITNSNIRKTTLAVFKPLWNLLPEVDQKKAGVTTICGKLQRKKANKNPQNPEAGTQTRIENSA